MGSAMRETQENGVKFKVVLVEEVVVVEVVVVEVVVVEVVVVEVVLVGVVLVEEVVVVGVVLVEVGEGYTPPSRIYHPKVSIIYVLAGSPTVLLY